VVRCGGQIVRGHIALIVSELALTLGHGVSPHAMMYKVMYT
jgi:hypothetical protein